MVSSSDGMKVTVIYGQSHKGITWTMAQLLIEDLGPDRLDEFMLPRDGPPSCIGCNRCFLEGEDRCPHHDKISPILESMLSSDVIILAGPNYVDGMTGAMKDLMDHLAFIWMSHRPRGEMFVKTGVVITSSAGAVNRHVLSAMRHQMRSWMMPRVHEMGLISHARGIDDLSERKRRYIDRRCRSMAGSIRAGRGKVPFSVRQRFLFAVFRSMQSGKAAWNEADRRWWEDHGWLDGKRPWKGSRSGNGPLRRSF